MNNILVIHQFRCISEVVSSVQIGHHLASDSCKHAMHNTSTWMASHNIWFQTGGCGHAMLMSGKFSEDELSACNTTHITNSWIILKPENQHFDFEFHRGCSGLKALSIFKLTGRMGSFFSCIIDFKANKACMDLWSHTKTILIQSPYAKFHISVQVCYHQWSQWKSRGQKGGHRWEVWL